MVVAEVVGIGLQVSDASHVLFLAVSEADSVVKVAEWQQTYYASDSGIQSGATTVRDDESSTEYSGRKKYTGCTTPSAPATATVGGGEDSAAGGVESPTGETLYRALTETARKPLDFNGSYVLVSLVYFYHLISLFICVSIAVPDFHHLILALSVFIITHLVFIFLCICCFCLV